MVKMRVALKVAASTFSSTTMSNFDAAMYANFLTRLSVSMAMVLTMVPEPVRHIVKTAARNGHSLAGYSASHNVGGRTTIMGRDTDSTLKGKMGLFLLIAVVVLVFGIILSPIGCVHHN